MYQDYNYKDNTDNEINDEFNEKDLEEEKNSDWFS